jgi:hypothetical protein
LWLGHRELIAVCSRKKVAASGLPGPAMRAGLALELLAAPLLALWRERLERRLSKDRRQP